MSSPLFPPRLGLVFAVIAFAFPAIFIRFAAADGLSIAFLRLFFAAILLWPIGGKVVLPGWRSVLPSDRWTVVAAGLFLGLHMLFWVISVVKTTVASASFLIIIQPLLVAVFGHFLIREKLNRWVIIAVGLALLGSGLINGGDLGLGREYLWGDFLALCGALMGAFYLLSGRRVRKKIDLLPYITLVYSIAALLLFIVCIFGKAPFLSLSAKAYFWCLMLALVPTLIGHSLYNWALRYLKAFTVNISIIIEPIGATIMAWFFFREQPSFWLYPGAGVLVAALLVAFKAEEQ